MAAKGVYQVMVEVIDPEGNRVSKALVLDDTEIEQSICGPYMEMRFQIVNCSDRVMAELTKAKGWHVPTPAKPFPPDRQPLPRPAD